MRHGMAVHESASQRRACELHVPQFTIVLGSGIEVYQHVDARQTCHCAVHMHEASSVSQEFGVNLVYYGRHRKPKAEELGAKFQPDLDKFLAECDVITINCPLTDKTRCCRVLTIYMSLAHKQRRVELPLRWTENGRQQDHIHCSSHDLPACWQRWL